MDTVLLDDFVKARLNKAIADGQATRAVRANGAVSVGTSVGAVRDENQDASLCVKFRFGNDPSRDFDLLILCDGMGGMRAGREASAHAIMRFVSSLVQAKERPLETSMFEAIQAANESLYRKFGGSAGTTLSAVALRRDREAIGIHAGDSRIYTVSDDGALDQISHDDTLSSLLNRGSETEFGSKLVQYVGMGGDLEPHTYLLPLDGQRILLTSDGVHGIAHSTLLRLTRHSSNNHDMVRKLLTLSDVLGGWDNATAIVAGSHVDSPPVEGLSGCLIELTTPVSSLEIILPIRSSDTHSTRAEQWPSNNTATRSPKRMPPSYASDENERSSTASANWWGRSSNDRRSTDEVVEQKRGETVSDSSDDTSPSGSRVRNEGGRKPSKGTSSTKKRKPRTGEKSDAEKQLELKSPPSVSVEFPDEGDLS